MVPLPNMSFELPAKGTGVSWKHASLSSECSGHRPVASEPNRQKVPNREPKGECGERGERVWTDPWRAGGASGWCGVIPANGQFEAG